MKDIIIRTLKDAKYVLLYFIGIFIIRMSDKISGMEASWPHILIFVLIIFLCARLWHNYKHRSDPA